MPISDIIPLNFIRPVHVTADGSTIFLFAVSHITVNNELCRAGDIAE